MEPNELLSRTIAATVMIAVPGFFILDALTGIDINRQLAIWVPFAVIFPLLFFHHSRSLWLVLDHLLSPPDNLYRVPPKKTSPLPDPTPSEKKQSQ
jgi:hypothetical protein